MARCGVASRRKCEEMIAAGQVKVNGKLIKEPGFKVDPEKDKVEVNGKLLETENRKVYIMLNKPEGYVSTADDQFGRPTVLDLIKGVEERIYPVGRLDFDTEGLILLTNDGDFTFKMTHPSHEIEKEYIALVKGIPTDQELKVLREGVCVEDYITSPAKVELLEKRKNKALLRIIIHEGRNRQVRKMCEAVGHPVEKLKRTAIGTLKLGNLKIGKWRFLTGKEVRSLK
jgi:23S rRNA pseudouridine2605 synthase